MRRSIRLRYIGSFLIIVIIPAIMFSIFFYSYSVNNANNEINKSRLSAFEQVTTQINYALKEMDTIALHMSSNLDSLVTEVDDFTFIENRFKIQSLLLSYENNLSFESKMCFYVRGQNDIFLSDQKISYSAFEQSSRDDINFAMSKFFTNLNSLKTPYIYRLNQNFLDMTQKKGLIAYIFPLPYLESRVHSNVIFLINEDYFFDVFENAMGSFNGDIYIFNRFLNLVCSNAPAEDNYRSLSIDNAKKIKGTGLLHQKIDNQKLVILRSISEDLGLTYIVAMNENEFYNRIIDTSYPLFLLIGALMFICILLAVMMAYYNYRPIKSLIYDITGEKPDLDNANELDVIKNMYNKTVNEKMMLSYQLDMQNRIVENQFLYKLITGKCSGIDELKYIESYTNLKFDKNNNLVIVVSLFNAQNKEQQIDQIISASVNLTLPDTHLYVTEMLLEESISYVCNYNGDKEDNVREEIAHKIWSVLTSQGINNIMLGVGSIYDDPMEIHLSYIEATAALKTALLNGDQYIFLYRKDTSPNSVDYYLSAMDKSLLIEGMQHGNEQVALTALDTIIQQLQRHCSSFLIMQLQCFDVLNMIIKLLSQEGINIDSNDLAKCAKFNSLTEFKEKVNTIIDYACKEIKSKRELDNTKIKSKVLTFIHENYCRSDFSLEFVSSSLGITKSRINSILREDTMCSFVQYVSMLRTAEVKRQLRETDKKIQDIVTDVGYIDVSNFSRKFKNSEGLTLGQYRQLNK